MEPRNDGKKRQDDLESVKQRNALLWSENEYWRQLFNSIGLNPDKDYSAVEIKAIRDAIQKAKV